MQKVVRKNKVLKFNEIILEFTYALRGKKVYYTKFGNPILQKWVGVYFLYLIKEMGTNVLS